MSGDWQRHLENVPDVSRMLVPRSDNDHDADAIAVAEEMTVDEGRISRKDVVKGFGPLAAEDVWSGREAE